MKVWLRPIVGGLSVGLMALTALWSHYSPAPYRFEGSVLIWGLCGLGVATALLWRGARPGRRDWALAGGLVAAALAWFPDTSMDYLRYLFDGEMIRVMHASPYVHLPGEFPVDQYSRIFIHRFWSAIPSPYGPLWQALMVAVNWVTGNSLALGIVVLKLINLAGLVAGGWYLYRISGRAWVAYLYVTNPVVLINSVATPHLDGVIAALVLAAYYHRGAARGGLMAAAGLLKLHVLILAPFFSRDRREAARALGWLGLTLGVTLPVLSWALGFDWGSMIRASAGGGVNALDSLLVHNLMPGWPPDRVFAASYALFAAAYGALLVVFWRGWVAPLTALGLASLLVPLCLTGLVLPWHFIIPLAWLLLNPRPVAFWGVLFITLVVLRSAVTVLELLALAGLFGFGGWVVYWVYRQMKNPPWVLDMVVRLAKN